MSLSNLAGPLDLVGPASDRTRKATLAAASAANPRHGERVVVAFAAACAGVAILAAMAIFTFLGRTAAAGFRDAGPLALLAGLTWKPEAGAFGGLPLVVGTLTSAVGAVVLGALPALLVAVWLSEFASARTRTLYRRVLEVAASLPSVVFGWLALVYLVPLVAGGGSALLGREVGGIGLGSSSILLAVMVLPTVGLLALDELSRVSASIKEASEALGATPLQTAFRVVLPAASRGLVTAVFFGFARAAGETMAVQMVIGNARRLAAGPFEPTTTIATQIVMDMQNSTPGTPASNVLFSMSVVLLTLSAGIVLVTRALGRRAS